MHRQAFVLALLLIPTPLLAQQRTIAGDWRGYWTRAGDTLPIVLHVQRDSATRSYKATFDAERLRVAGIPFTSVQLQGSTITMRLVGDRTTSEFTGTVRGNTISGDIKEGELGGAFSYTRMRTPAPPLREREVSFTNGDVTLAGSLLLPASGSNFPAVVFTHGSGGEGRWASRFVATALANNGVAALIFDKRGVGKSTGDWSTASLDDLAGDAIAAVRLLAQDPAIDHARIGLHGHSQGGTIAPLIVARSRDIAFVVASAASGVPTDSTEIFSILNSQSPSATTAADSADLRTYVGELVNVAYHGGPRDQLDAMVVRFQGRGWFFTPPRGDASYWTFSRMFGAFDPLAWWRQVRVPTLLVYGAADQRVPARESATRIAATLARNAPAVDVTVRIFPGADHTFRLPPGPSGWPATAPDYLSALVGWIKGR